MIPRKAAHLCPDLDRNFQLYFATVIFPQEDLLTNVAHTAKNKE
jgi:hypothetical protein